MGQVKELWFDLVTHLKKVDVTVTQYQKFEMSRNHTIRARALNALRRDNERIINVLEGGSEDDGNNV